MTDLSDYLRTDYKAVDKHEGVHAVMGWLRGDSDKLPIVVDEGKPFGLVNERALATRSLNSNAKLEHHTLVTRALPENATVEDAARRMAELRAAFLPVADKRGKLAGYVSALDVARERGAADLNAAQLLVPITTLRPEQTVGEALHAFTKEYIDHLPVVDAQGQVTGVLHRRELVKFELNAGDKGRQDAMGEKLHPLKDSIQGYLDNADAVVTPKASFDDVERCIRDWGYALVQQDGRVAGIITPETLLRSLGQRT